ncbi:hypothetical protein J3R74_002640 [Puniceicoccus vermicola]
MATAAQVNEWHSTWDVLGERRIIGGLTLELIERLKLRSAVEELRPILRGEFRFNSAELAGELETIAVEHSIRLFLLARCVSAKLDDGKLDAAIIEDASGRRAIRARYYIDASGDGSLLQAGGFSVSRPEHLQPVNLQALVAGVADVDAKKYWEAMKHLLTKYGYPSDNSAPWYFTYPGAPDLRNLFGTRLNGIDAADADAYTAALIEGRRLHRAYIDMLRAVLPPDVEIPSIVAWAQMLGVRQTRHAICQHRLSGQELLACTHFSDSIAQGTYPVDIHSSSGTILRYLDGREERISRSGKVTHAFWHHDAENRNRYYTIPYRSLIPVNSRNLLVAGRLLDADQDAFGAVRVMVNLNQTGEAAGTAVALACKADADVDEVSGEQLKEMLKLNGSLLM